MTRRYTDTLTGQDMILNKFSGFKLAVKTFDSAQIDDRKNGDTLSFSGGEGDWVETPQLSYPKIEAHKYSSLPHSDTSVDPKAYPLPRRQLCLGLHCMSITDLLVLNAINSIEDATEQVAAMVEWQNVEEYIFHHPWVTNLMASIGLCSDTVPAAWIAGGDA